MKEQRRGMELRKQAGLTQLELANRLNIRPQTISAWEHGQSIPHLSPTKFKILLESLNCTVDQLIEVFEQPIRPQSPEVRSPRPRRSRVSSTRSAATATIDRSS
jgi:transcriptional regulator with XRE-family HTH domain